MKNISAFILIIISVLLFFVYARPEYDTITSLQMKQTTYQDVLNKSKDLKTLRDSLVNKYNSISPQDQSKLQSMVPQTFNSVRLVSSMNTLATQYGMIFKNVQIVQQTIIPDSSQIAGVGAPVPLPYKTAIISFAVTGTYTNFLAFLKQIEASQELIDVTKVTIVASKVTSSGSNLDFNVSLQTYYIN
jgi:Tfp pilus assembly protein PilO